MSAHLMTAKTRLLVVRWTLHGQGQRQQRSRRVTEAGCGRPLGLTLAAPTGVNAYIPLIAVALAERLGWLHLDAPYDILGEWWVIAIIAVLALLVPVLAAIVIIAVVVVARPAATSRLANILHRGSNPP